MYIILLLKILEHVTLPLIMDLQIITVLKMTILNDMRINFQTLYATFIE